MVNLMVCTSIAESEIVEKNCPLQLAVYLKHEVKLK